MPGEAEGTGQGSCISLRIVCTSSPLYMMNKVRVRDGLTRLFIADWSMAHVSRERLQLDDAIRRTYRSYILCTYLSSLCGKSGKTRRTTTTPPMFRNCVIQKGTLHTNVSQKERNVLKGGGCYCYKRKLNSFSLGRHVLQLYKLTSSQWCALIQGYDTVC